jgi:Zn-dependent dipeptidase, microsomal dipeptidase homolog
MQRKLSDLHCDTFEVLFNTNTELMTNNFSVSIDKAAAYEAYIQVAAIWSDSRFTDEECWDRFLSVTEYTSAQIDKYSGAAMLCGSFEGTESAENQRKSAFILAIEDARLLCGDITRLDTIYNRGVRFLTMMWGGETIIGGSFNADGIGLAEFGDAAVRRCFELGIIPDISHASRKTADDILNLAKLCNKPVVATHSNAFAVRDHARNLTDDEFKKLMSVGGIAGISFCDIHLSATDECTTATVIAHIRHYFELGGENHVALGCDFDGINRAPDHVGDISKLQKLADDMAESGFTDEQIDKVFYRNVRNFIKNNLK